MEVEPIPKGLWPKVLWLLNATWWIPLLLSGEQFLEDHYRNGAICFGLFVICIGVIFIWGNVRRRQLAWMLIIVGALVLGGGIWLLAAQSPAQSVVTAVHEPPSPEEIAKATAPLQAQLDKERYEKEETQVALAAAREQLATHSKPSATAEPAPAGPVRSAKSYADGGKELAGALRELSKVLDSTADDIVEKSEGILKWRQNLIDPRHVNKGTVEYLSEELVGIGNLTGTFHNELFGQGVPSGKLGGLVGKYKEYRDVLDWILPPFPDPGQLKVLSDLGRGVGAFRDSLKPLGKALDLEKPDAELNLMLFDRLNFAALRDGSAAFKEWLKETRGKIETTRESIGMR